MIMTVDVNQKGNLSQSTIKFGAIFAKSSPLNICLGSEHASANLTECNVQKNPKDLSLETARMSV